MGKGMKRSREITFRDFADLIREAANEASARQGAMSIVLRFEKGSEVAPFRYRCVGYRPGTGDELWFDCDVKELVQSGGELIEIVGFSDVPDQRGEHSYSRLFVEYSNDKDAREVLEDASNSWQGFIRGISQIAVWANVKPELN